MKLPLKGDLVVIEILNFRQKTLQLKILIIEKHNIILVIKINK